MSKHFPQYESRPDETWVLGRGTDSEVSVTKAAVRVRKGAPWGPGIGNRPGTFQGATNFRGSVRKP